MFNVVNVRDDIMMNSQEAYIGELHKTEEDYVRSFLSMYQFHPYRPTSVPDKEEALQIAQAVLSKAVSRFSAQDFSGLIDDEGQYLYVFNTVCVDIAREEHELSEADFMNLFAEYELMEVPILKAFYKDLTTKALDEFVLLPAEVNEEELQREQELIRK